MKSINHIIAGFLYLIYLSACSDSRSTIDESSVATGQFIDSEVSGLYYQTETRQGVTSESGEFEYLTGATITFSIGDINFPSIAAFPLITPLDIFDADIIADTAVLNLSRLLQSLDSDDDPANGLSLASQAHLSATGLSIDFNSASFESDVSNLLANSGSTRTTLISVDDASSHLQTSLDTFGVDYQPCVSTHSKVGQSAEFSTLFHLVSGRATIINNCQIQIDAFNYDGLGPAVAIYAGTAGSYANGFKTSEILSGQSYSDSRLIITLPAGKTLDDFDGISVWCYEFNANFGDANFTDS